MKISLDLIDLPELDLRASVDEDALDELADSLRDHGQLQPIGVTAKDDSRYEVVFGARRTRAARMLNWSTIEANVREASTGTANDAAKLIENVQRLEMTPMEEAYGIAALVGDDEIDIRKLQRQTGKGRAWIITRLDLIAMPDDLQQAVQDGSLSIGVAKEFSAIENEEVRRQYIDAAKENGCTASQARVWATQAHFAESGIMAMNQHILDTELKPDLSETMDRNYNCFVCKGVHSWRRISTVVICGSCIDAIGAIPIVDNSDLPPRAIDSHDTIVAD